MTGREKLYELMNNWRDINPDRSVNCYFCGSLADERDCIGADDYNDDNGGSICKSCVRTREKSESLKLVGEWVRAYYRSNPDATEEDQRKAWDIWLNDPVKKQRWEEHVQKMMEVSPFVTKKTEQFRIDHAYGNVYEWDEEAKAYLFHCKLAVFDESLAESPATMPAEDFDGLMDGPEMMPLDGERARESSKDGS